MRLFVLVTLFLSLALGLFGGVYADAEPEVTDKVFFDMEHGGKSIGRIVVGLYGKDVPKVRSSLPCSLCELPIGPSQCPWKTS